MRRIAILLSVVIALFGLVDVNRGDLGTSAQEMSVSTLSTMAAHPVVGAWWWENISDDPFDDSYAIFHADGTYVEETTYIGAGIGSWQATGERSADLIIVFQDIEGGLDPDRPAAFVPGTIKFWLSIAVDATGDKMTATGPVEIRSADGALVNQFTFNGTATRLGVGWERPSGTPTP